MFDRPDFKRSYLSQLTEHAKKLEYLLSTLFSKLDKTRLWKLECAGDANEFSAFCYADTLRAQRSPVANLAVVFDTVHVQTFLCPRPSIKFINVLVQSDDLHIGLVSWFLSILSL
jgi:hypothetical protein